MVFLYRLYQLLAAPLLLVITVLTAVVTIVGCALFSASWWSYWPGRLWSQAMVRILLLPVRVEGRANMDAAQSYVIVPNHQGAFDIFLIYGFLNRHFKWVLKQQLRQMPLVGRACESAGFIFINQKGGPNSLHATQKQARSVLTDGVSVVVFPEGTRTFDGSLQPFKRGAFQLAHELQLPILPITIKGSYRVLPRTRGFGFVDWHPLMLTIHEPFMPQGTGGDAERRSMEHARSVIAAELSR